jgi:hypothetical protein
MKPALPVLCLLLGLGSCFSFSQAGPFAPHLFREALLGQTICLTSDGRPCPPDPEMKYCADEKVLPNLSIAKPVKLSGILLDGSGVAPIFPETQTIIQIRDSASTTVLLSAPIDEQGRFYLGTVPAGKYRLLAVGVENGKIRRLPLTDQPTALSCNNETVCNLRVATHYHGTDDPIDFCPPK